MQLCPRDTFIATERGNDQRFTQRKGDITGLHRQRASHEIADSCGRCNRANQQPRNLTRPDNKQQDQNTCGRQQCDSIRFGRAICEFLLRIHRTEIIVGRLDKRPQKLFRSTETMVDCIVNQFDRGAESFIQIGVTAFNQPCHAVQIQLLPQPPNQKPVGGRTGHPHRAERQPPPDRRRVNHHGGINGHYAKDADQRNRPHRQPAAQPEDTADAHNGFIQSF